MCMQDIMLADQLVTTHKRTLVLPNTVTQVIGANGLRFNAFIELDSLITISNDGSITGSVDPVTGDVNEIINFGASVGRVAFGYIDGGTFVPLIRLGLSVGPCVLRYTDIGSLMRSELYCSSSYANALYVAVTDVYFRNRPEV